MGLTGILSRNSLEKKGLQRYRGLWDLQGYWLGSLFRPGSYVRIRICGTYRRLSQLLTPFSNESRIASHVVGMLLAIATLVVGARSVLCLLPRINAAEVIRVLSPPLLIEPPLLFLTALRPASSRPPSVPALLGRTPTVYSARRETDLVMTSIGKVRTRNSSVRSNRT